MEEHVRYHMIVSGRVQGVGFRYRVSHAANALGLTGWVTNCWNDTVELEVQGPPDVISQMLDMAARSEAVWIEEIRKTRMELQKESGFHIR